MDRVDTWGLRTREVEGELLGNGYHMDLVCSAIVAPSPFEEP